MQLTLPNGTLFQPFSVETRSLLVIVITRLPCKLPIHRVKKATAHRARAVVSFVLSDVLEEVVIKNQRMSYTDAIFLVYKERHVSSTDCTTRVLTICQNNPVGTIVD